MVISAIKWIFVSLFKSVKFVVLGARNTTVGINKAYKRYDNKRKDFKSFERRNNERETEMY